MRYAILLCLVGAGLSLTACAAPRARAPAAPHRPRTRRPATATRSSSPQCMRAHGVPNFPDPTGGRIDLQVQQDAEQHVGERGAGERAGVPVGDEGAASPTFPTAVIRRRLRPPRRSRRRSRWHAACARTAFPTSLTRNSRPGRTAASASGSADPGSTRARRRSRPPRRRAARSSVAGADAREARRCVVSP